MRCFKSNVPQDFTVAEIAFFRDFLQVRVAGFPEILPYSVLLLDDKIIGCGGLGLNENDTVSLTWGLVHRDFQKKGLGKMLLAYRLRQAAVLFPGKQIRLDTTQQIASFFEKYGFQTTKITPDGYAPGMHRYDMERMLELFPEMEGAHPA